MAGRWRRPAHRKSPLALGIVRRRVHRPPDHCVPCTATDSSCPRRPRSSACTTRTRRTRPRTWGSIGAPRPLGAAPAALLPQRLQHLPAPRPRAYAPTSLVVVDEGRRSLSPEMSLDGFLDQSMPATFCSSRFEQPTADEPARRSAPAPPAGPRPAPSFSAQQDSASHHPISGGRPHHVRHRLLLDRSSTAAEEQIERALAGAPARRKGAVARRASRIDLQHHHQRGVHLEAAAEPLQRDGGQGRRATYRCSGWVPYMEHMSATRPGGRSPASGASRSSLPMRKKSSKQYYRPAQARAQRSSPTARSPGASAL